MAESKLPTTPSSSGLAIRPVELSATLLVLVALLNTLYLWLGLHLAEFTHRLARSIGGPLDSCF